MSQATHSIDARQSARSSSSSIIKLLAERIVAEWTAEQQTPALEQNKEAPQNASHDDTDTTPARRELQPV